MKFAYLIEPPFNYREPDGIVSGCDIALARHVLRELGEVFEPVEAEFSDLLPGLGVGRWRMTTGLFPTEERLRIAAFSQPIWALPDGLLVATGNPKGLHGYRSVAASGARLAVIRDQIQHRSAVEFGVPEGRIVMFETYTEAAEAVAAAAVDAYASVARAHMGFLAQRSDIEVEVVAVPMSEKAPAFGAFGFALGDDPLRRAVDDILGRYLGTPEHRAMMAEYGFEEAEINLIVR